MEVVDGIFGFLFLYQIRSMQSKGSVTIIITREVTMGITSNLCFLFASAKDVQGGKCRSEMPPQSLLLPSIEISETFAKAPNVGTSPAKLLKERLI
jgi:hypothetical protein